MIRFILLAFNVAAVTFLIYTIFEVIRKPLARQKKAVIITAGIILLIVPFAFLLRIIPATMLYFLLYPVAVSLFVYLIWVEKR
ncbi:MAG: hypothetical protein JNK18_06690 [Cyclobacteriaceae bacterium]|jgi:hypothetical protein|nr:hypothetical protein [Cyclobacteriaceae bacterium]